MILDLLFPKWCLVCKRIGCYLCQRCSRKLEYVKIDGCIYCDKISEYGTTHQNCKRKNGLDGVQSFLYYSPEMKEVMKELKYNQVRDAYHEIFWSLNPGIVSKIAFYHQFLPIVYIQPLPLHNRRLQDRGFNQAEVFAKYISQISNIPLINAIHRKKDNPQQARQRSKWYRYLNTHGSFEMTPSGDVEGKTVILFDDVITSGTTVKEAARVLKKAGAASVFALSLLRD